MFIAGPIVTDNGNFVIDALPVWSREDTRSIQSVSSPFGNMLSSPLTSTDTGTNQAFDWHSGGQIVLWDG